MRRRLLSCALIYLWINTAFISGCETPESAQNSEPPESEQLTISPTSQTSSGPKRIIFMIGDGMGVPAISAASYADGEPLSMLSMPDLGFMSTHSYEFVTTDSAASGTALATGHKTHFNGLSVKPGTTKKQETKKSFQLRTLLEEAESKNWATGLIATSRIVDATPAAFASHRADRHSYEAIAQDIVNSGVDLLMGAGTKYFGGGEKRKSLLSTMKEKGFRIANSKKETLNAVGGPHRLAALLHPNNMPGIIDEKPRKMSLAEMTQQALTHLESQQANGFFLMVEGSQIDWEKHNMSGHGTIDETRDFDRAVETALDYARDRQDTLVVVTSDHDTAGMAITSPDIANAYLDKMGGTEEARKELAPRSALEPDDGPKSSAAPKPVESFKLGSSRPSKTEIRNAEYTFGPDLAQDKRIFTAFSYLPVASYAYRDKDTSFYAPHTPNFTPIFSEGPDSSFIAGASDNAELGEKLKSLIRDADPEVSSPQNNNTNKPENTIVVLAEGLGLPPVAATMYAEGPLAIRNFSVKGLSSTHSRDNLVSDKAAAATAIATGEKTRNGALSTSEGPKPHILPTLLESAEETGKSTALITTRKWRHVVPASFFAHSPHCPKEIGCGPETDLLEQFADMQNRYEESDGIDVSISFGVNKLEGNQRSLLRKRGYSIRDTWRDDNLPTTGKIMQFVNSGASLEHVTKATLERLSEEEKGFVALIHDHRLAVPQKNVKTNDSLIEQMLQFDRVIQEIASFAENHRDTAVIVTSLDNYTTSIQDNHYAFAKGMCGIAKQCGGPERFRRFKVSTKNIDRASGFDATELQGGFTPPNVFIQYSWIIQEVGKRLEKEPKSANFVPVWASGPGTDKFEGFQQQFEIGQKLKSIIRP